MDTETFEFSEKLLDWAKEITLAELLDTPFTQAWTVSMMSNALFSCDDFTHPDVDSEKLQFSLHRISMKIKANQRMKLFNYCSSAVSARRQARLETEVVYHDARMAAENSKESAQ